MHSTARETANRTNAQKSTGPVTAEGKAKSSKNAVTTALTGSTVLLPSDNPALYEAHLRSYVRQFGPVTEYEHGLVQSLADIDWRLHRIPHLLFALEAKGSEEFAAAFADQDPGARELSVFLETRLKYEKQFRNLELQESRLQRLREKAITEIQAVIKDREARRKRELEVASQLHQAAAQEGLAFDPADHGFEFSIADLHDYMQQKRAALLARQAAANQLNPALSRPGLR